MKKRALFLSALCILGASAVWFIVNSRLRTPTPKELQSAFPGESRKIFENGDKFVLLSLDPSWYEGKNKFHGYRILGQTQLNPETKARLIAHLYDGIADKSGFRAACFSPRHGIHVEQGNKSVDLVICFHCHYFRTYLNGEEEYVRETTKIPTPIQPIFDRILTDNNVPLSPP